MTNKLKMEFIGTFFLVLVVAITGNPLAIGGVLIALVYMGGYISGAHYNPAVTAGLWMAKKIPGKDVFKYIGIQMLAGLAAAFVFHTIAGFRFLPSPVFEASYAAAFLVEVLFTFLLVSVILHVAATEKTKNNHYYGAAIGLTLMVGAFVGGPISGGAFNPAVGVSPLLYDFMKFGPHIINIGLYLFGPIIGGLFAGMFYQSFEGRKRFFFF